MPHFIDRFISLVTRFPKQALAALLVFVALMAFPASTVRLDNNFSKLYATATEADEFRLYYRSVFGANDGLFVAVLTPESPADPRFMNLLAELSNDSENDDAIARVYSATNTSLPMDINDTVEFSPIFGPESMYQANHAERVATIRNSPLGNRLVSRDGKRFVIGAEVHGDRMSFESIVKPEARFRRRVEEGVARSGLSVDVLFGGIPHTRVHATRALEGDLFVLAPFVTALLALFLWVRFRSIHAVAVSMTAVAISNLAAAGVIGAFDDDLNFVTIIYPILLTSIAVAHSVHMIHQFGQELKKTGGQVQRSARIAATRVTKAAILTSLTTAIGFGSLAFARVTILRSFGIYLSAGVVLSFIVVTVVLTASFVLIGAKLVHEVPKANAPDLQPDTDTDTLDRFIQTIVTPRGSALTITLGAVLLLSLAWYAKSVRFDYVLSDHAKKGSALAQGNTVLDEEFGGTIPIEVSFLGESGDMLKPGILARMQTCAEWLQNTYDVPPPIGLPSVLREVHREFGGPDIVPDNMPLVSQLMLVAESSPDGIIEQLVTDDRSHARLRTTAIDGGAEKIVAMHHAFDSFAAKTFEGTSVRARMTGDMVIGYDGMRRLSQELVRSVLIALALVILVIGVAFKSPLIAAASVLPNVLPIVGGLALLNASGSVVNPVPGIVFCVGLGLSVDDTIHLIAIFKEELNQGATTQAAVAAAVRRTKGALITTTLALSVGFFALLWSDSDMNRTFGWLGTCVILIALVADLSVTPAVLARTGLRNKKQPN